MGSLCERVEVGGSRAVHHCRPLATAEDDRAEHQQGVRLRHDCQCADDRTDRQQCESCRQDGEAAVAVTDATSHPQRGHARQEREANAGTRHALVPREVCSRDGADAGVEGNRGAGRGLAGGEA